MQEISQNASYILQDCGKSDGRYRWKKQRLYATATAGKEECSVRNVPFP